MRRISRKNRAERLGFTLVEVLVATVLLTIGIVGALGAIRATEFTSAKTRDADLMQRLAAEKMQDLSMLSDPSLNGTDGTFSDRGYPDITWSADIESTSVANLDQVTVTATRGSETQAITSQVYVVPTTTTTTGSTPAGGATP